MTLRDIVVAFGYEVDSASERQAENSIKGIKNLATKLLGSIAVYFSVQGLSSLAQAAADVEALESQFTQVFGDMEDEATESLQAVADEAGALVNRMKGSFTQLAAFTKTTGADEAEALALAERGMKAAADSAAFYDRSLEDVTASLQNLLKGNYENDAALGFSCTEITRNTAANKLYGKSFQQLSEYQKQLTLLQMVEDANALSGALDQASREADTWTNQLGNMQQAFQDLKAVTGSIFLQPAIKGLKLITSGVQKVTSAIKDLKAENGLLTRGIERGEAIVKRLQPSVERMTQSFHRGFTKGKEIVGDVITKLGGIGNVLKIIAVAFAAYASVMTFAKAISSIKTLIKTIKMMDKALFLSKAKVMLIIAVITILFLVMEDFIHFMKGNDSVIGTLFDKAGIGADNARKIIIDVWKKATSFLFETWKKIKETAKEIFASIKETISKHTGSISDSLSDIWGGIEIILSMIWENLLGLGETVFGGLFDFISGLDFKSIFEAIVTAVDDVLRVFGDIGNWISEHKGVMETLIIILGSIAIAYGIVKLAMAAYNTVTGLGTAITTGLTVASTALGAAIAFITSPIGIAIAAIAAIIAIGVLLYKNWDTVKEYAISIWESIVGVFQSAWEGIKGIFSKVGEFFKGVWDSIVEIFTSIGTAISDAISKAVKGAINSVLSGAAKIINGFISAINFAVGIINKIPGVDISKIEKLEVPQLAEGGIATKATSAIIGEGAEPEAVMPLSKLGNMISGYIKKTKESDNGKMVSSAITYVTDKISTGISTLKSFVGNLKSQKDDFKNKDTDKPNTDTPNPDTPMVILPEPQIIEKGMQLSELGKMIGSYIKDIKESDTGKALSGMLKNAVGELTTSVSAFNRATIASPKTASTSTTNNQNSSVVQNVEINNSYSGTDRESAKTVSKAMKKSAVDATTQMARSLAYARG